MQLPVFDIITEAVGDTWEGRRDFASYAFLPVLVMSIAATLITAWIGDLPTNVETAADVPPELLTRLFFGSLVYAFFSMWVYALFAVAWHRRILIGPESVTIGTAMRFGRRQWNLFRRLFSILIILFFVTLFLSFLLGNLVALRPLLGALPIIAGLVYARLALTLPAAATDTRMSFGEAIRLSKGNSWRLLFAVVLLPLAVWLIGGLSVLLVLAPLAELIGSSMTAQLLVSLIRHTINFAGLAAGITALSLAYRQLTA